jgi:HSP20 family molecular chaperone IbpA
MEKRTIPITRQGASFSTHEQAQPWEHAARPAVDIFETEDNLTLVADLPGADKDQLDINLDQGILTLKARDAASLQGHPLSREFALSHYFRQFHLPDQIAVDQVTAEFKHGVLTLVMPKTEAAKPHRIEIHH